MLIKTLKVTFAIACLGTLLSACSATTSGSQRLDESGNQIAAAQGIEGSVDPSAGSDLYISSLRGGIVSRIAGLSLSSADKSRALEAEYKALEVSPGGRIVSWSGTSGASGQVVANAPYQVGAQNCRQYSHTVVTKDNQSKMARGAACRNDDGSWTPLS